MFRQLDFSALLGTIHNSWYDQESDTASVYGQGSWHITPDLDATLSLRYTYEKKDVNLVREQILNPVAPAPLGLDYPLSGDRSENLVDPTFTLNYQLTDSTMLFARYAQGSKGGGFIGASRTATAETFELEEEVATSYELGTRIKTEDGSGFIGLTAFYTEYEDLQVSSFNGTSADFGNAGEAETKGAELELSWQFSESLRFDGSLAYLDAEYTSYPGASCVAPRHIIPGCTEDIAGSPLHHAPEWSASASLNYNTLLTDALEFDGTLGLTYEDDSYTHATLMPESLQKSFTKVDLRLALAAVDGLWEIAFVGKTSPTSRPIARPSRPRSPRRAGRFPTTVRRRCTWTHPNLHTQAILRF